MAFFIKHINTIRDLVGGSAGSVITIADLERVIRGEHARFFNAIAFADIATIHNQFYNNWLPSITRLNKIRADDIIPPTGSLFFVFQDLIRAKTELLALLNRVREVFRTYRSELHIDELVDGAMTSMHGFALLMHVHGVYAELRRIQIGAPYLHDERLVTDTLAATQYITDAQSALDLFMNSSTIVKRRLDMISSPRYFPGSSMYPPSWSFSDSYRPRTSTPAGNSLRVPMNGDRLMERVARERHKQHIMNVTNRMGDVFLKAANDVQREYTMLKSFLNWRYFDQIGIRIGIPLVWEEQSEPIIMELEERIARHEYVVAVPFDAEEFTLMSERIKTEALGFAESDGATQRRIRASL